MLFHICEVTKTSYTVTVKNLQESRKRKLKSRHTVCEGPGLWEGASVSPRPTESGGGACRAGSTGPGTQPAASAAPVCAGARGGASARGRGFGQEPPLLCRQPRGRPAIPAARGRRRSAAAMQAAEEGGAEGRGHQSGRDGRGGRGGPRGAGAAAAANDGAPHVAPAQPSSGPGGDPACTAGRPGSRPHVFALSVPFPSTLEAEIARGSLAPDAEPHQGAVGKELTVSGSILSVRWRAEDSRLLRISIVNFLDQLSLVIRTMQRFGPPVAR
ncbi:EKC/KEOPS complex subunit LAGE3-like [Hippopotamus amphibius kiboko]|uniref:EKC/KEOPS complex subunit LAGE3-like n=1 Tax=Hippopotamus amphibius kiboko TaxID=575201 RepID=UPI0025993C7A|nr:EKC/KEOPS complex subunit LAGE3-like [Hippopotamus amphibius kiboko]